MPQQAAIFRLRPAHFAPPLVARQVPAAAVVLGASTLSDNFDDNSLDTTKWSSAGFYEGETTSGTASETNQRLEATPTVSTICATGYVSVGLYDLTDNAIYVQLSNVAALDSVEVAYLTHGPDDSNYYTWLAGAGGNLIARRRVAGSNTDLLNTAYNATTHAWLRIRHQSSDNTIHFETATSSASNPPAPGDWTSRASETFSGSLSVTSGKIAIGAANFAAATSPAPAFFDGFNTATVASSAITGTAASTEADDTTSATGNVDVSGTGATTESADTGSTTGAVTISGTEAATEANDTASASGSVTVSGTQAVTEGADTTSASGSVVVMGTGSTVEANDNASATGTIGTVTGTASSTESADTASGAGSVIVAGPAASTEANDNCSASGTVGSAGVTGAAASTEAADTSAAIGSVAVSGSAQSVELSDTASAVGTLAVITGSASTIEAADTGSGAGTLIVSGTLAANDNPDTCSATGEVTVPPRQYPLAGIVQPYPGQPQTYAALPAQPYPIHSAQTYPLEGESQDYPLRGTG